MIVLPKIKKSAVPVLENLLKSNDAISKQETKPQYAAVYPVNETEKHKDMQIQKSRLLQ